MSKKILIEIYRNDGRVRKFEKYMVPFVQRMRVLDALHYIHDNYEGSLAYRWNCRAGQCGSCSVEVNGKAVLACKAEIPEGTKKLKITPLKVFPVIKDLVVDRSRAERETTVPLYFQPKKNVKSPWIMYSEEVKEAIELRKCIDCYICFNSCHAIRDSELDFIGPRDIVKAVSFEKHPMDKGGRAKFLDKENIWYCNVTRCCTDNCPLDIRITQDAIVFAKESIIDETKLLKNLLKKFRGKK